MDNNKIYYDNCNTLINAINQCAMNDDNNTIRGELQTNPNLIPIYYKDCIINLDNYRYARKITFSQHQIKYPYNRYYTITKTHDNIEIELND